MQKNLNDKPKTGLYRNVYGDTINVNKYGLFYAFATLKEVCPKGWHIPSNEEWRQLELNCGIAADQQPVNGWHGDDLSDFLPGHQSGFNLLWSGEGKSTTTQYLGERAYFWATKEEESNNIYRRMFIKDHNRLLVGNQGIAFNLSVRCIKDDDGKQ